MHSLISKLHLMSVLCAFASLPVPAYAVTLHVNCGSHSGLRHIQEAINLLQRAAPSESNTILVSGSCNENIIIQSFDNLTLTAQSGASISDNSDGALDVLDIFDSRRVSINSFSINGGANGVTCAGASLCRFSGNTVRASSGYGIVVASAHASFSGDVMQDNTGRGLSIINDGDVNADSITVQGSADGIVLNTRGTLILSNSSVNGNQSHGILAITSSTIRLFGDTVTANGGDGVGLQQSSQAKFDSQLGVNTLTNNGSAGVNLDDLSFAFFAPSSIVTGNAGGTDVLCNPQFSATRGALTNIGGGTTNCVEP